MRKKLNIRADADLVQQAKASGINISRLTEQAITECIRSKWEYMGVHDTTIQPEIQSTQNESRSGNGVQDIEGWRVGRNPPSVLGDIHLIGIPAPLAEVTGAYYPFHDVGWHFTLAVSLLNASASLSQADRGFFLRLNPTSRSTLRSATRPPRGWSFLRPQR